MIDDETINDWIEYLAHEFAKARTGESTYMAGKHNPLPSELRSARIFIREFLAMLEREGLVSKH